MADANAIDKLLNDANAAVASWYSIITNRPAIVPGVTADQVALQQATGEVPTVYPVQAPPLFYATAAPGAGGGATLIGGLSPIVLLLAAVVAALLLFKD